MESSLEKIIIGNHCEKPAIIKLILSLKSKKMTRSLLEKKLWAKLAEGTLSQAKTFRFDTE